MDEQTSLFQWSDPEAGLDGLWALEITGPASWPAARTVWEQVQLRWSWPTPALAVNGRDGFLLLFRWPALGGAAEATAAWLALLAGLAVDKPSAAALGVPAFRLWPLASQPARLPPQEVLPEQWAAFVTRDLAPIFADTPWLDVCPGAQAQAEHVSRLKAVDGAAWEAFLAQVAQLSAERGAGQGDEETDSSSVEEGQPGPSSGQGRGQEHARALPPAQPPQTHASPEGAPSSGPCASPTRGVRGEALAGGEPLGRLEARQWLLSVMHDGAQPMAHRLEAARLLLGE